MRALTVTALLIALSIALCGCNVSGEVENQAYALVFGMDRLPGGELELTARVPRIGKSGGDQPDNSGASSYLVFSAVGSSFPNALEQLQLATPRELNLSHIEMLVVSEALARESGFGELINQVAETPHLYTSARFVVCEGTARAFMEAQEPVIGTRLSSEINAMLGHYAKHGYIPDSSFADVYYATNAIYSDPVAAWASLGAEDRPASLLIGPSSDDSKGIHSPMKQRYMGAGLFRDGSLVGHLDVAQTVQLGLLLGNSASISVECDGTSCSLAPDGALRREVRLERGETRLLVTIPLSTPDTITEADARRVEASLSQDLRNLIAHCQRLRVDPFGFAERAAARFPSVPEWIDFNWRERYAGADISVQVSIRPAGIG